MEKIKKIFWTNQAVEWLEKIFKYIAIDNQIAAANVIDGIYNKVQKLAQFPEIGYVYKNEFDKNIRIILYGHYRIAYLIKKDSIDIIGVFHGALEIENYIE